MAKRRWYRLHWGTWLGMLPVAAAVLGLGLGHEYRPNDSVVIRFEPIPVWFLPAVAVIMLAPTAFVLERFFRKQGRWYQWSLGSVFALVAVVAVIAKVFADDPSISSLPVPLYFVPFYLAYFFAYGCYLYTVGWLVVRLIGWLYKRTFRGRRRTTHAQPSQARQPGQMHKPCVGDPRATQVSAQQPLNVPDADGLSS
jgi:hypothetical protein